jgi:predicted P-loop ATPase/GTPase
LIVSGVVAGHVVDVTKRAGCHSGTLVIVPDSEQLAIQLAVQLAVAVDESAPDQYLEAWYRWDEACRRVLSLGLRIGNDSLPIESFGIDSDWRIEWQEAASL